MAPDLACSLPGRISRSRWWWRHELLSRRSRTVHMHVVHVRCTDASAAQMMPLVPAAAPDGALQPAQCQKLLLQLHHDVQPAWFGQLFTRVHWPTAPGPSHAHAPEQPARHLSSCSVSVRAPAGPPGAEQPRFSHSPTGQALHCQARLELVAELGAWRAVLRLHGPLQQGALQCVRSRGCSCAWQSGWAGGQLCLQYLAAAVPCYSSAVAHSAWQLQVHTWLCRDVNATGMPSAPEHALAGTLL